MADGVSIEKQGESAGHSSPNYYFILTCMAGLTLSVAATITVLTLQATTAATASFAAGAAAATLSPLAALLIIGGGICLLPFLFAGCMGSSTTHRHGSSYGHFHSHGHGHGHGHGNVIVTDHGYSSEHRTHHHH